MRIKENIKEGEHIQNSSLETVTIGGFNLPNGVILHAENVVGRYATTNMYKGDYIFTNKLSDTPITEFEYLTELDGTKQAISVTLKTFATGLSGKLESGDIVSIIASDYGEFRQTVQPSELKYVQVIAVTDKQGYDKAVNKNGNEEEKELPSTITLLVNEEQSKILAELESEGKIHVTLVYRGDNKNAEKFLKTQEEFFYKEDTFEATGKENTDIQTEENILHESEEGEGINE